MKILLLVIILYLISGPADCSDVIGYSGGSVFVYSDINWYKHNSKYICKVNEKDCTDIIRVDTKRHQVQEGRFLLYANTNKFFLVLIRKLKPQDAGMYRFGLGDQSNLTMNLNIYNNTSSGLPKIINAYLGQNITITCNYPGKYERNTKFVNTVDDDIIINRVLDTNTKFQNGRFSISDDRSAKVLSVNISDVRKTDEVFYLFGVYCGDGSVKYSSYFTEVWLHVTDTDLTNSTALIETPSAVCFTSSIIIIIIISVCVFETLLLIGGCGLMIYKVRQKRTQDNTAFKSKENKQLIPDYNTDSASVYENIKMSAF
ncbi:polymeric immunoglobulin receptor-like [Tachysurus fulvidraco]|uniref:polymeric immunoglobulin receptor-like n=1 Tax=Tachysurus fulvidraco TaxID=1234273 RepID=UPI001FEF25F1|nr:polymeric immunoglobulin receptor-like [Tachysurus fulvidraco]